MRCVDVLLIEPVRLCASGLKHLLLGSHYTVTEEVHAAASPLMFSDGALPELVLLGPGASAALEAGRIWTQRRRAEPHRSRFVVLVDTANVSLVRHLASSGVDAVLSQDIPGEILQRSLDLVMLGQQLFPPLPSCLSAGAPSSSRAATQLFPIPARRALPLSRRNQGREVVLSQREGQVLRWLVDGASNKVIARELQISETTVKAHIKALLRKVHANNRTQAAIWALENDVRILDAPDQPVVLASTGVAGRYASL